MVSPISILRIKKDLVVLLVLIVVILAVAAYLGSVSGEHNEHFIGDCPTYNGCRPYIPMVPPGIR